MRIPGLDCYLCGTRLAGSMARATPNGLRCPGRTADCNRRATIARVRAERVEDLRWMAEHGEGLHGAARRIGMKWKSVEQLLRRANERDLLTTLIRNNPHDWNTWPDGSNINDLTKPNRHQKVAA
ncbi:hypothetical protein [Nocardioides jensenii]|uniref:hypothetical protein n=1 Tax=Nocardioides jensenii TaxID=1843 RepID=UPI00082B7DA1|nr:hypothetical protein [Nocardioides jensenii]